MAKRVDERKKEVLKTLKKHGPVQHYSRVCDEMQKGRETKYDKQAIKRDLDALCRSGIVKDLGKGVYEYQKPKPEKMPDPRFAAYGYRWKRDLVEWNLDRKQGRPKKEDSVKKALWGKRARGKRGKPVNFAEQVGVYLLHNGDRTVYVGRIQRPRSGNRGLYDRLREHAKDTLKDDWDTFSWFGFREVNKKDCELSEKHVLPINDDENKELLQLIATIEAVIINGIRPRGNSRGGDIGGDRKYEQCSVPEAENASAR